MQNNTQPGSKKKAKTKKTFNQLTPPRYLKKIQAKNAEHDSYAIPSQSCVRRGLQYKQKRKINALETAGA